MMAILSLQRRLAEVGRIRLGHVIESKGGKKRPAALATFRLTSSDRTRIEEAARLYGGAVTKWEAPNGLPAWEVITQADRLPVVVPPSAMAFSQYYELWAAGGCQRRCDGVYETLSEQSCICNPEDRQCEIHTRLSVMLRDLSGLGVWRVDTQGYYAAVELQGAVEVISLAAGKGQMLPATLRLDQRSTKREGEGTKKFVVPVLDIEVSPAQLLMGTVAVQDAGGQITARPAALTPVPQSEAPPASIADQVAASEELPSRRRVAPIKSTGILPRTAAQAREAKAQPDAQGGAAVDRAWNGEDAGFNRRMADQFGLQIPEGVPGHPYDRSRPPADDDEAAYAGVEAAREAAEQTQDPPRMSTRGQLTKLNILLGKQGFESSDEGREAKLAFCMAAVRELMPKSPWAGRVISSSKELTFDEAGKLIELLEAEEAKPAAAPEAAADAEVVAEVVAETTSEEPVDNVVDNPGKPLGDPVDESCSEAVGPDGGEPEPDSTVVPTDSAPGASQIAMI